MTYDLNAFIEKSLERKASKENIRSALLKAGWDPATVKTALDYFADVENPIPVPSPRPYLYAREALIYLVLFLCLYISTFSFGALLFDFINRWVPDVLQPYETSLTGLRRSLASVIITFPLLIWLSDMMNKAMHRDSERRGSKVRKWLTYSTLFITAATIIGDLVTFLFTFLNGGLTARFLLKVAAILIIAAVVFGYYLWSLRSEERESTKAIPEPKKERHAYRTFIISVSAIVLAAVVTGLFIVGSPITVRRQQFDDQRLTDLQQISSAVHVYYGRWASLPATLDDLSSAGFQVRSADPRSSEPYEYAVTGPLTYKLCAVFDLATPPVPTAKTPEPRPYGQDWSHSTGRSCFNLIVKAIIF